MVSFSPCRLHSPIPEISHCVCGRRTAIRVVLMVGYPRPRWGAGQGETHPTPCWLVPQYSLIRLFSLLCARPRHPGEHAAVEFGFWVRIGHGIGFFHGFEFISIFGWKSRKPRVKYNSLKSFFKLKFRYPSRITTTTASFSEINFTNRLKMTWFWTELARFGRKNRKSKILFPTEDHASKTQIYLWTDVSETSLIEISSLYSMNRSKMAWFKHDFRNLVEKNRNPE